MESISPTKTIGPTPLMSLASKFKGEVSLQFGERTTGRDALSFFALLTNV